MTDDELIRELSKFRRALFRPKLKQTYGGRAFPVATEAQLGDTETQMGLAMPRFLRRLYSEVGNGGFGPGYGLLGAVGGSRDDHGETIVEAYRNRVGRDAEDPTWDWPTKVVPLISWGGNVYSCGDFSTDECRMRMFDPAKLHGKTPMSAAFREHGKSLRNLFDAWASGGEVMLG